MAVTPAETLRKSVLQSIRPRLRAHSKEGRGSYWAGQGSTQHLATSCPITALPTRDPTDTGTGDTHRGGCAQYLHTPTVAQMPNTLIPLALMCLHTHPCVHMCSYHEHTNTHAHTWGWVSAVGCGGSSAHPTVSTPTRMLTSDSATPLPTPPARGRPPGSQLPLY